MPPWERTKKSKKTDAPVPTKSKAFHNQVCEGPQWYTLPPVNPQTRSSKESSERERKGDLAKIIGGAREGTRKYLATDLVPAYGTTRKTCKSKE